MNISKTLAAFLFLTPFLAGQPAGAADGKRVEFTGELAAGYKYDSNVNLAELDSNTGNADSALLLDLGHGSKFMLSDKATLKLGYDYSQTAYRQLSGFDLAIHRVSADLNYDAGVFDAGMALHDITARLDHDGFIKMRRLSPSIARLFDNWLYLRGAFIRSDKDHLQNAGRSATNDSYAADAYVFLDGLNSYFVFGYRTGSEDAVNDDFDYDGHRLKLQYAHRFDPRNVDLKVKAGLQSEDRDYRQILQSSGARRNDDRLGAVLSVDLPFADWFTVTSAIEYSDRSSNLATADFHELTYSVNLAAAF